MIDAVVPQYFAHRDSPGSIGIPQAATEVTDQGLSWSNS